MGVDSLRRESSSATMKITLCNKEKGDEIAEKLFEFQQTLTTSKLVSNRLPLSLSLSLHHREMCKTKLHTLPKYVRSKFFSVLQEKL
jgi:hypothetical protein